MDVEYIYVIEGDNKLIKIGVTKDIKRRLVELENTFEFKTTNLFITDISNYSYQIENMLHKDFEKNSKGNEWFELPFDIVKTHIKNKFSQYEKKCKEKKNGRNIVTIKGVTPFQYQWIKKEAKDKGLNVSAIVKLWLQKQAEIERKKK